MPPAAGNKHLKHPFKGTDVGEEAVLINFKG